MATERDDEQKTADEAARGLTPRGNGGGDGSDAGRPAGGGQMAGRNFGGTDHSAARQGKSNGRS